jgi:glycosyltransferase involved in cell wall biosynthesis
MPVVTVHKGRPETRPRKPRILWANSYCLLDTSSGASMAVREMLLQLERQGFEVAILGATVFDTPKGITRLKDMWPEVERARDQGRLVRVQDGPLAHDLVPTASTHRDLMTNGECSIWLSQYLSKLKSFRPDLVFFYGGQPLDLLIAREARVRGIPAAFYLANGNYSATTWCRDVDLILTDSQATCDFYRERHGYPVTPVGAFIDPSQVVAGEHRRERVLMINPSLEKGVGIFIQVAMLMAERRPDITFEVVESRGNWPAILTVVGNAMGRPVGTLPNVVVTPNTQDMRPVYGRSRLLLAPSLWWESSGRVLAEAMLNGIPAIITDRGGMPEMVGDAGLRLSLPAACHEPPYDRLPKPALLAPLIARIEQFYDDEAYYQTFVTRAYAVGKERHGLQSNTARLVNALAPLLRQRAGDLDSSILQRQAHKLGLGAD